MKLQLALAAGLLCCASPLLNQPVLAQVSDPIDASPEELQMKLFRDPERHIIPPKRVPPPPIVQIPGPDGKVKILELQDGKWIEKKKDAAKIEQPLSKQDRIVRIPDKDGHKMFHDLDQRDPHWNGSQREDRWQGYADIPGEDGQLKHYERDENGKWHPKEEDPRKAPPATPDPDSQSSE